MTAYCVFNVGDRRIGIALEHVREIIEPRQVVTTPIPLTPAYVQGLFNLRGQVLPLLDLSPFVGAQSDPRPAPPDPRPQPPGPQPETGPDERAVIVERGPLRFATTGRRIDTVEADPSTFTPLTNAALLPALDAEASTDYGRFQVIHLDRLEACLIQSLKLTETPVAAVATQPTAAATQPTAAASRVNPEVRMGEEPPLSAASPPTVDTCPPATELRPPTPDLCPPSPATPDAKPSRRERRERRARTAQS